MSTQLQPSSKAFRTILEEYLALKVLSSASAQNIRQRLLKWIAIGFGISWGLPWIWSCLAVGNIFPSAVSTCLGVLFAFGIVVTVGADGWWIMREAHQYFERKSAIEKAWQTIQQGEPRTRYLKKSAAFLFASCSCIAPVYASIRYTSGLAQYLSFITLVVYYGYGLVGYTQLIDKVSAFWQDRKSSPDLIHTRQKLSHALDQLAEYPNSRHTTASQWITYLEKFNALSVQPVFPPEAAKLSPKQRYIQKIIIYLIPPLASLVSVFLIHDFLYAHIWSNAVFAIITAIIAELPGFVINTLATVKVSGYMLEMLNAPSKNLFFKSTAPLLLSLLAPVAAVYITYTTLTAHQLSLYIVLPAMIAIGLARIVFSWFTLTHVIEAISTSHHAEALRQSRIRRFVLQFSQLNPAYFELWPKTVGS